MKFSSITTLLFAATAKATCVDQNPGLCTTKFAAENWREGCDEMPKCVTSLKDLCCESCKNFAEMYVELKQKNWPACTEAAAAEGEEQYDQIVDKILHFWWDIIEGEK